MPIHDQGYRRYAGHREAHGRTWLVIARAGVMERLRERKFLGLLLVAWLPFLVRSVQLYVAANYAQASFLSATPSMFRDYLAQQGVFVFFITLYVGSGLIANDRRANALQIYLSKPLSRVDYIVGKLATLLIFLTAVTGFRHPPARHADPVCGQSRVPESQSLPVPRHYRLRGP